MPEFPREQLPHLNQSYGVTLTEHTEAGLDLPYPAIGGPGFERLCYHLLVAEGKTPRFFGRTGQAQFGIDLIISDGHSCEVYQCKNVVGFGATELRTTLSKFENEWRWQYPESGFPTPTRLVICVTEKIRLRIELESITSDFYARTSIPIDVWDGTYLDTRLQKEPDIVADVFGDQVAERFCRHDDWCDGRWLRLLPGVDRSTIDRYLQLQGSAGLVLEDELSENFREILSTHDIMLIEGNSGSGKTVFALALAEASARRVIYLRIDPRFSGDYLFQGVKSRLARETIFVFDDCHGNWQAVEEATQRIRAALRRPLFKIVQVGQTAPKGMERTDTGAVGHVDQLRADDAAIRIEPSKERFRKILLQAYPDWRRAPDKQVEKVYNLTAGNLATLDILTENGIDPDDVNSTIDSFSEKLAIKWFGTATPVSPMLHAFASVAQFEITRPAEVAWPDPEGTRYSDAIHQFVFRYGDPGRGLSPVWCFSHARDAEIVSRVLSFVSGNAWEGKTCDHIVDHLIEAASDIQRFSNDFRRFLHHHLSLVRDSEIKATVLSHSALKKKFDLLWEELPLQTLSEAANIEGSAGLRGPFGDWLSQKLESILESPEAAEELDLAIIGMAFNSLSLVDENKLSTLKIGEVLDIFRSRGTVPELFRILGYSNPAFSGRLIEALDDAIVTELIDRTIEQGRSIGTLSLALRGLADRKMPGGGMQLEALQSRLGDTGMLRLIRGRGTVVELFRILQQSSPAFSGGLIEALDDAIVTELIDRTIEQGRSIGTLDLALRGLADRKMPGGGMQLEALQSRVGDTGMLRLIRGRGTVVELFRILEHSSPAFSGGLIEALDDAIVTELIDRTIEQGRSIGTLGLALRGLADRKMPRGNDTQLEALQSRVGDKGMLRLIRGCGTVFELFRILQHSSPAFSGGLIEALDDAIVTELIDRTIEQGRSIGTLDLALRDLADRKMPGGDDTQLEALQSRVGDTGMLRLIRGCGTVFELFRILQHSSPAFSGGLIEALDDAIVTELVDKTIEQGRSIGTLNYALQALSRRPVDSSRNQREVLESKIDPRHFWRLVEGAGDLNDLTYLLGAISNGYLQVLVSKGHAPDTGRWRVLVRRGSYFHVARFTEEAEPRLRAYTGTTVFLEAAASEVPALVAKATWYELATGLNRLNYASEQTHPDLQKAMRDNLLERIAGTELSDIEELDFSEAVNAIRLMWEHRLDVHARLAKELCTILPAPNAWPKDHTLVSTVRLLFPLICDDRFSAETVQRIVGHIWPVMPRLSVETAGAFAISWFLWNLNECLVFWQGRVSLPSPDEITRQAKELLLDRLKQLVLAARTNNEKIGVLCLAGTITYIWPSWRQKIRSAVYGRIRGFQWLLTESLTLTFVPAALTTLGLTFVGPVRKALARDRVEAIVQKLEDYGTVRQPAAELANYLGGLPGNRVGR